LRQKQRGNLLVRRQHIADFDAQHFQYGIGWRGDFHFPNLRIDLGKRSPGLGNLFGARSGEQQIVATLRDGDVLFQ
jgi:hypothetical protein